MGIIIYDTDQYTYDDSRVDYDGVVDVSPEDTSDITSPFEVRMLDTDDAGPSSAYCISWTPYCTIHFVADDVTDVLTVKVTNDGDTWITHTTLTGPDIARILGPFKQIKVERVSGNGAVFMVIGRNCTY